YGFIVSSMENQITQLADDVWIAGAYYIEFDPQDQLNIVGPGNHLHFGSVNLYKRDLVVDKVEMDGDRVKLHLRIPHVRFSWQQPVMGHIRRVRSFIDIPSQKPVWTYRQIVDHHPGELQP